MTSNGLVPLLRYRDVPAAIDWLSSAFGLEKRSIVTDPAGTVDYAELSYGRGIVMLGPVGQSVLDRLLKQPDELGGIGTQSVYVAVDDVQSHFRRARDAGATIVLEFGSEEAGDRAYAARDPEGHIWNFGAYSPWPATATAAPPDAAVEPIYPDRRSPGQSVLGGAVAALAIASVAGLAFLDVPRPLPRFAVAPDAPAAWAAPAESGELAALKATLAREAHARQEAARTAAAIRQELAREKAERVAADTARRELERKLAAIPASPAPDPTLAATPLPAASAPVTAAAPPLVPPAITGSLGTQPREAAIQPTADQPELPTSVAPLTLIEPAPKSVAAPPTAKPVRRTQQVRKRPKPAPKKSTSNDPFFMYD